MTNAAIFEHWIFDMDGTLTVPTHDFNAVRTEIDVPEGQPILEYLERLDPAEAAWRHKRLEEIEWEHAKRATADPGATTVLQALADRGRNIGIVTRNGLEIAHETVRAAGLEDFFRRQEIIARESAPPKPAPDGVLLLVNAWNADPTRCVMVGDYIHDLLAGNQAGTATIHLDHQGTRPFAADADHTIDSLIELMKFIPD